MTPYKVRKPDYKKLNESQKTRADYRDFIRSIIKLIKYYTSNSSVFSRVHFSSRIKRFYAEAYAEELKKDLQRELRFYKWNFKKSRITERENHV